MANPKSSPATLEAHFGFRRMPFVGTEPPESAFTSAAYWRASSRLLNGIRFGLDFILLTGEAGVGKTVLLRKLAAEAPAAYHFIHILSPDLSFGELVGALGEQLGLPSLTTDSTLGLNTLKDYLNGHLEPATRIVLAIDDAHELQAQVLRELPSLAQLDLEQDRSLTILLSGRPALEKLVRQQQASHALEINAVYIRLEPLAEAEVADFIHQQLQAAGAKRGPLFKPPAIERIAQHSRGLPRLVNALCYQTLQFVYAARQTKISAALVDKAINEGPANDLQADTQPHAKTESRQEHVQPPRDFASQSAAVSAGPDAYRPLEAPKLAATATSPDATAVSSDAPKATLRDHHAARRPSHKPRPRYWRLAGILGLLVLLGGLLFFLIPWNEERTQSVTNVASTAEGTSETTPAPSSVPLPDSEPADTPSPQEEVNTTAAPEEPLLTPGPLTDTPPEQTEGDSAVLERPAPSSDTSAPSMAEPTAPPLTDPSDFAQHGDEMLALGNVDLARRFYQVAAEAGNAEAATALGETYDPVVLEQRGLIDIAADPAKAEAWYQKAAQTGAAVAEERLATLHRWLADATKASQDSAPEQERTAETTAAAPQTPEPSPAPTGSEPAPAASTEPVTEVPDTQPAASQEAATPAASPESSEPAAEAPDSQPAAPQEAATPAKSAESAESSEPTAEAPPDAQPAASQEAATTAESAEPAPVSPQTQPSAISQDVAEPDAVATSQDSAPTAAAPEVTSSAVIRAILTSNVRSREPVDQLGSVVEAEQGIRRVFYFTEIRNLRGESITHRWEHEGKMIFERSFSIGSNRWRVYSSKRLTPSMTGRWQVSVLDSEGNLLNRSTFLYQ